MPLRSAWSILIVPSVLATNAASAAPPIVDGSNGNSSQFTSQIYEAETVRFNPQVWPIARQYREASKWGGSIPTIDESVVCEISDDGEVNSATCEAESWLNREQQLAMKVARDLPPSSFPKFPAINRTSLGLAPRGKSALWSKLVRGAPAPASTPPFFRLVKVPVHISRTQLMIDLSTGPLVDFAQVELFSGKAMKVANYPSKAMREGRGGTQIIECQIQEDRSIICHSLAFDPPQNASYFAKEGENAFRDAVAKEHLKDGRSSVGMRFQMKFRWQLPSG